MKPKAEGPSPSDLQSAGAGFRPAKAEGAPAPEGGKARRGGDQHRRPDPRPAAQILAEEVLLTKAMLAKVLGYKTARSVDNIVAEDCASAHPCLKPVYIFIPHKRRRRAGVLFPPDFPSFKSLRFRLEDVLRYLAKMQRGFPEDLEWKAGQRPGTSGA